MQQLSHGGHEAYFMVVEAKFLHERRSDLKGIKLMPKVLAKIGFSMSEVFPFSGTYSIDNG